MPSVRAWAQRDYGNRVGIWRIMEVLQKHGVRASPTMNSDICDHHPQIVRACVELGWEILGHNETNSRWLNQMEPDEERQSIARALGKIAALSGKKPKGWLGAGLAETWNTLDHLLDEGVAVRRRLGQRRPAVLHGYRRQETASRSPIPTRSTTRRFCRRAITRSTNSSRRSNASSIRFTPRARSPAGSWRSACIPYLIGVPHRITGLDDALAYIAAHDGVWFATGTEIVQAWQAIPAATF